MLSINFKDILLYIEIPFIISDFSFQALVHGEVTKEGDKITIRTKRQQCVCIVVSPGSNQLQCNCDNTQVGLNFAESC